MATRGSFCVVLDINKKALRNGKILSIKKGLKSKVDFILGSAINLPFKDCSIDLVTCFSVLDHLPTKDDVRLSIHEFSRVVKDHGYVAITFPNKLFLIGTISMKLKRLLDADAMFESRFTPREMREMIIQSDLTPLAFDAKYPTKIGNTFLKWNLPKVLNKVPKKLLSCVLILAQHFFGKVEKMDSFRLFGARFGYLAQKV